MSDDCLLPPNGADRDGADVDDDDIDAEEAAAASALAQALEGRSASSGLPDAALETAALLRYSRAAAELSEERRAALRQQVLASLPAASSRSTRTGSPSALWRWLGLGVPLTGAAAALWLVVGAFQHAAQPELSRRADERAASAVAADDGAQGEPAKGSTIDPRAVSAMTAPRAAGSAEAAPEAEAAADRASESEAASGSVQVRRRATANEDRAPMVGPATMAGPSQVAGPPPGALASRLSVTPRAPSAAGLNSRAEAARAEGSGAGLGAIGSGAGLAAAEAKRSPAASAPTSERLQRSSQRLRARLLPRLADARVDQTYAELDRAQSSADLRQAQSQLSALSSGPLGGANGSADSAEADVLRQDIYCRLAEVALRLGQAKVALDWARRGLELPAPPNAFAARLWHVQGQARAALGDADGAAESYMKAIEVNERLLDESLDGAE